MSTDLPPSSTPPPDPPLPPPPVTREQYAALRSRVFGAANPERQTNPAWEWMVRTRQTPYTASLAVELGYTYVHDDPGWCFDRVGTTRTDLPDGRVLFIAGEHEDWYDPNFCIYNDVVVLRPSAADRARAARRRREWAEQVRFEEEHGLSSCDPDPAGAMYDWGPDEGLFEGGVEIYGYPRDVFPPTDSHSATLVGGRVILIGRLGYAGERTPGVTPVMALDVDTLRIEPLATTGEAPGWIYAHEATLDDGGGSITVRGGKVVVLRRRGEDGENEHIDLLDEFRLHLADGRWEKLTDRSAWRQFDVDVVPDEADGRRSGWLRMWELDVMTSPACAAPGGWRPPETAELLELPGLSCRPLERPDLGGHEAAAEVEGVPVRIRDDMQGFRVVLEGAADDAAARRIIDAFVARARALYGQEFAVREV